VLRFVPVRRFGLPLLLLLGLARADVDEMEALERDTEALAYRLLDLSASLRKGDAAVAASLAADTVDSAPYPAPSSARETLPLGLARYAWAAPEAPSRPLPAAAWAKELLAFVSHAGEVEYVLFKPAASERRGDLLEATAKFHVIGRGSGGRRTWTRGRAAVACGPDGPLLRFRILSAETLEAPGAIFEDVAGKAGLSATDPAALEHPTLGLAAYGAAAGDVNGDGRIDLFVTAHDGNSLYVNKGDGTFERRAVKSPRQATAPLLLDFDNDGDLDLFLSANGEQMLLENRAGEFADVSGKMGVAARTIGFTATAGDVNGDARPDIYVTAYNNYGPVGPENWHAGGNGLPNLFFVSRPDGTYEEAGGRGGVADSRWSYAAEFCDVDGDGALDLYVANDFGAGNGLFMRRGEKFVDEAEARGVLDSAYGMGVSFSDYDNDGRLDLHVTRMSSTAGNRILARLPSLPLRAHLSHLAAGNGLYRNKGAGFFEDVSAAAGPFPAGWAWGGGFLDIDNDGWEDLFTPNGHMSGASEKDT
jgi:hypothetical protein